MPTNFGDVSIFVSDLITFVSDLITFVSDLITFVSDLITFVSDLVLGLIDITSFLFTFGSGKYSLHMFKFVYTIKLKVSVSPKQPQVVGRGAEKSKRHIGSLEKSDQTKIKEQLEAEVQQLSQSGYSR